MNYEKIKESLQNSRRKSYSFPIFAVYDSGKVQPVANAPAPVDYSGFKRKDVKNIIQSVEIAVWDMAKETGLLFEHTLEVVDKAIIAESQNDEIGLEVYNDIIQKSLTELDIPYHA